MTAHTVQRLYIQSLYSRWPLDRDCSPEANYLRRTMNSERLDVERKARLRNLRTHLHNTSRWLKHILDNRELLVLVEYYAEDPAFWQFKGRTLMENFCFVTCFGHHVLDPRVRSVLELEGRVSGAATAAATSPWETEFSKKKNEYFILPFFISVSQPEALELGKLVPRRARYRVQSKQGKLKISVFTEKS